MANNKTLLERGVGEVIIKKELEGLLNSGKKLRVKFGIDPTAPDLHLGHTVPLRKLSQFQDAGHQAVFIIGDSTAMIGDPTGRSEERKPLTKEQVEENLKEYLQQAGKIIDLNKCEIHYNSEWFATPGSLSTIINLGRAGTMQQMLHRADFKKRLQEGNDITIAELQYPLMQGYDSVMVRADVEIGGTDQKFNLLMGRQVQKRYEMTEQQIVITLLLEGTDGVHKMSKSRGNYIGLMEMPDQMFGKIMTIPDALIDKYYNLLTDEERKIADPREAKLELGKIIVDLYHGAGTGEKARENFINIFSKKEKPEEMAELQIANSKWQVVDLLVGAGIKSKSEARRLVEQGGVKINDEIKKDVDEVLELKNGDVLQIGKRRFYRLKTD